MAEVAAEGGANGSGLATGGSGAVGVTNRMADDGETQIPIVKSDKEKIGRNEPCWCGSGKKFKLCHGAN
jgi:preprotein translocase subunit SecA